MAKIFFMSWKDTRDKPAFSIFPDTDDELPINLIPELEGKKHVLS